MANISETLYHWHIWFKVLNIKGKKRVLEKLTTSPYRSRPGNKAKIIDAKIKCIHENYPEVIL